MLKRAHTKSMRLQSLMEYIMAYGWVLIMIAVILAVLIYAGVFNPLTYAPKVPGGSCEVIRPLGPGTIDSMSIKGACSNELPVHTALFNNVSSHVNASVPEINTGVGQYNTVSFWLDWNGNTFTSPIFVSLGFYGMIFYSSCFGFNTGTGDCYGIDPSRIKNVWIYVVAKLYNGPYTGNSILYINGVEQQLSQRAGMADTGTAGTNFYMGYEQLGISKSGQILLANVQIYNTSLGPSTINSMYISGIGADPQALEDLIGWWPLNGDSRDYSGDANDGTASSLTYTSGWYNAYTIP